MKKVFSLLMVFSFFFLTKTQAQLQQGNIMIGSDLADLNLNLGGGGQFSAAISPKVGFFISDNVVVGGQLNFKIETGGGAGTTTNYGVGAFGRYYLSDPKTVVLKHGRFFFEGNVGINGVSLSNGSNTNGLGIGVGPGYAYFITPNIGLETLLKYNGIVGFGSQAYNSNLSLGVGFQIYLPGKKAKAIVNDLK